MHGRSGVAAFAQTTVISSAHIDHSGRAQGALRARVHWAASSEDQVDVPAGTELSGIGTRESDTQGLCGADELSPLPVSGNVLGQDLPGESLPRAVPDGQGTRAPYQPLVIVEPVPRLRVE